MTEQSDSQLSEAPLGLIVLDDVDSGTVVLSGDAFSGDSAIGSESIDLVGDFPSGAGPSLNTVVPDPQIVFIDGSVPDAAMLAAGVNPGVIAVLLDPGQDGVRQIADYLATHHVQDLAAIDIVAHGNDGIVQLGSTLLSADTIGDHQAELAQIGQALRPGGDLLLYGCDVAQDAVGDAFLQLLSQATGGTNVAASSHLVGSAVQGGDWTLNVAVGTIDVSAPFTPTTMASFPDVLPVAVNQVFAIFNDSASSPLTRVTQIGVSGSTVVGSPIDLIDGSQTGGSFVFLQGLVIDAAAGKYFFSNGLSDGVQSNQILAGQVANPGTLLSPVYTTPDKTNYAVTGLALDQPNHTIYFAQPAVDPTKSGIFKIDESGGTATPVVVNQGILFPLSLTLDLPDNLVFFVDNDGIGSGDNNLDVGNLSTGTMTTLNSQLNATIQSELNTNAGQLTGIAVDAGSKTLYFTAENGATAANNYIFSVHFIVSGGNVTLGTVNTLYSGTAAGNPGNIVIDPQDGIFYVGNLSTHAINLGSLTGAFALTQVYQLSAGNVPPNGLFFLSTPTITPNVSSAPTFLQGGSTTTLASAATVTNQDGQNLRSATVVISGGFVAGDTLTATTFGSISQSFSGGTLTLSGNDTLAHYIQELDSIKFSSTASNPTLFGTDASRTISWTVSDGIISSTTPTTSVSIHAAYVNAGTTAASFTGGGSPVLVDAGVVVGDTAGSNFTSATVTIGGFVSGDTLTVGTPGGLTTSFNSGTLTLTGSKSFATYQTALASITYAFTSGGDPTNGGSRTSSTISWLVNDGTVASSAASTTLNLIHAAPTISVTGTTATFTGGGPAIALGDTVNLTDPDSAGNLSSATVIISNGFVSGDTLTVGTPGGLSANFSNGTLTLTGIASIATYDAALDSLHYDFAAGGDPTALGTKTTRTLSWFANDGVANSGTVTSSINIQHVAPTISVSGAASTFTSSPVPLVNSVTIGDVDSGGNLTGATVSISDGFFAGDTLNFTNQNGITHSYNAATGVLTLTGTSSIANYQTALQSITYNSTGDATHGGVDTSRTISWVVNDGAASSSAATSNFTTACYLHGTRILTDGGEVAVEDLSIGDRVMTLSGEAMPIKWIGRRSYVAAFAASNRNVVPILIRAGALGENVPQRDLYVSPLHAMFIDGVLIPAEQLVNEVSVLRCHDIDPIRYFHIELERHDVIFADGAPAESFVDCDSRGMFHNAAEFAALYPGDAAPRWAFCAPRLEDGPQLDEIRARVDARAGIATGMAAGCGPLQGHLDAVDAQRIAGWAYDPSLPTAPVLLEVRDGDGVIARVRANRYRGDLEAAGIGDGRHGFELRLATPLSGCRQIHVRRMTDGAELPGSPWLLRQNPATPLAELQQTISAAADGITDTAELDQLMAALLQGVAAVRRQRLTTRQRQPAGDALLVWDGQRHRRQQRALVIDDHWLRPDRDAGSNAMLSHIVALQSLGWQVEFIAARQSAAADSDTAALEALGVTCHRVPFVASVEEVLRSSAGQFELVYLHRLSNAEAYAALARAWQPGARLIYSVADLHHVRLARQAALYSSLELMEQSQALKHRELAAMRMVDAVITHSTAEAGYLARQLPGAKVHVVPWALTPRRGPPPLAGRPGVAFLGSWQHTPNQDAVRWLAQEIMPLVWRHEPAMRCLIAGSGWPHSLPELPDERIELLGPVAGLSALFERVTLTVAPLRYGAGVKGKVLDSLAEGVPCVMTPVAAEGIALSPTLAPLVAADAAGIAALICALHADAAQRRAYADAGLAMIGQHHSTAAVEHAMARAIGQEIQARQTQAARAG